MRLSRRDKTRNVRNRHSDLCAQRRLKSAYASAQSDQSLHCPHQETLHPWLSKMRPVKILISLRIWIWFFAGRIISKVRYLTMRFIYVRCKVCESKQKKRVKYQVSTNGHAKLADSKGTNRSEKLVRMYRKCFNAKLNKTNVTTPWYAENSRALELLWLTVCLFTDRNIALAFHS